MAGHTQQPLSDPQATGRSYHQRHGHVRQMWHIYGIGFWSTYNLPTADNKRSFIGSKKCKTLAAMFLVKKDEPSSSPPQKNCSNVSGW